LLDDDAYRLAVLRRVRNPETRRFLVRLAQQREGRREQQVASTLHRLQRFLGTPFVRNIVGQRESRLDIREIMDRRRILLVDLSGIGVDNARFLGSLLTLLFRQAALSREEIPEAQRAPHYLILDECSWFLSKSIGEMADQARKFKLGLVLAAQRLGQLSAHGTLEAILAEVGSLICFRLGDVREARDLAQHLNTGELSGEDIRSLGQYEIYAQLQQQGAKTPAFWAKTMPPPEPEPYQEERRAYLIRQSRETYARPCEDVERELIQRERSVHDVEPEKRRRQAGTRVDAA
jgi:type IV secretory pathway TraG/TraD family ATPase VirD4